jgi:ribonuclease HI
MRVFTDGSCIGNGRKGAKAGYAVWFPEHPDWSASSKLEESQPQTNNRVELTAIQAAVDILLSKGCEDEDIVIYSDSNYSIDCLSKWILKWVRNGWKKEDGGDVSHKDLIQDISNKLARFKSHRFHHVRAHTGGEDDLSKNNDVVDRMARSTVEESKTIVLPASSDVLFVGCPLSLMGSSVQKSVLMQWIRNNVNTLDPDIIDKYLFRAFTEICKTRDVNLVKQTIQKKEVIRAEVGHLQIAHSSINKEE